MAQRRSAQRLALMQVEGALTQRLAAVLASEARVVPRSAERAKPSIHRLVAPCASLGAMLQEVLPAAQPAVPLEVGVAQPLAAAWLLAPQAAAVPGCIECYHGVGSRRRLATASARRAKA